MEKSLPDAVYTEIADAYAAVVDTKPHNAYYDRPAVQSLTPDVAGKAVLDAGCGPGAYAEWLLSRGAVVTAVDANEKMLEHARRRIGEKARLILANLEEPLGFLADGSFDGIVCPLTVAYLRDLDASFKEFFRVLKRGGWFVFSTEHPFFNYGYYGLDNYFETKQVAATWKGFGEPFKMPSHYHSLGCLANALTGAGFLIDRILEPKPTEEFKAADARRYDKLTRFPLFICFRAVKA